MPTHAITRPRTRPHPQRSTAAHHTATAATITCTRLAPGVNGRVLAPLAVPQLTGVVHPAVFQQVPVLLRPKRAVVAAVDQRRFSSPLRQRRRVATTATTRCVRAQLRGRVPATAVDVGRAMHLSVARGVVGDCVAGASHRRAVTATVGTVPVCGGRQVRQRQRCATTVRAGRRGLCERSAVAVTVPNLSHAVRGCRHHNVTSGDCVRCRRPEVLLFPAARRRLAALPLASAMYP